jgi:hypothetical protein
MPVTRAAPALAMRVRPLEVIPVLAEDRAVVAQVIVGPGSLPADLIVLQEVRLVRRQVTDAVDAAGPEALRVGGVYQAVVVKVRVPFGVLLVSEVDLLKLRHGAP